MRDPSSVAKQWANNLARSTEKIREGIQRVKESPTAAAARSQDKYLAGVRDAVEDGRWRRGLLKVSTADWQQAMEQKGLPRISNGAQAAQSKMESFMTEWLPYQESLKSKIAAMPKGNLEDAKARAIAAIEHNAAFKRRK
jgi:hypothetical protein